MFRRELIERWRTCVVTRYSEFFGRRKDARNAHTNVRLSFSFFFIQMSESRENCKENFAISIERRSFETLYDSCYLLYDVFAYLGNRTGINCKKFGKYLRLLLRVY